MICKTRAKKEWSHKELIEHFVSWFKDYSHDCLEDNPEDVINEYFEWIDFKLDIEEVE